jgi:hypothetical protein
LAAFQEVQTMVCGLVQVVGVQVPDLDRHALGDLLFL